MSPGTAVQQEDRRTTTPKGSENTVKYDIDARPPAGAFVLYGMQWFAVMLPILLIMGVVVAKSHHDDTAAQALYLQKIFVLTGVTTILQVLFGHRLPVVEGPATILMVGVLASRAVGVDATYTALMIGGAVMALAAAAGLMARIRFLFTTRVIAAILILIAVTLAPTIIRISLPAGPDQAFHLCFLIALTLVMVVANQQLPGVWKSLAVLFGLAGGSLAFFLFRGLPDTAIFAAEAAGVRPPLLPAFEFHAGAVFSFLFCFVGLGINQLGSVESLGFLTGAGDMAGRVRRGQILEGVLNAGSGALGVLGPVSNSLSAGIVAATGCAARLTLLPAAAALILCGLFPEVVLFCSLVPGVVMGAMMLYLMSAQIASGILPLIHEKAISDFGGGVTLGMSVMVGLIFSFLPDAAAAEIPALLRPIVANGFLMGTLTVLLLEHVLIRAK